MKSKFMDIVGDQEYSRAEILGFHLYKLILNFKKKQHSTGMRAYYNYNVLNFKT